MHEYDEGATDYNTIIDQKTKVRVFTVISLIEQSLIFVTGSYIRDKPKIILKSCCQFCF